MNKVVDFADKVCWKVAFFAIKHTVLPIMTIRQTPPDNTKRATRRVKKVGGLYFIEYRPEGASWREGNYHFFRAEEPSRGISFGRIFEGKAGGKGAIGIMGDLS